MGTVFNKEEMLVLLQDFHRLTGLRTVVFDTYGMDILSYPPELPAYCKLVRGVPEGVIGCHLCDQNACRSATRRKETVIYTCHAGLIEVITPILIDGAAVGFLLLSHIVQGADEATEWAVAKERCAPYGIDEAALHSAYDALPRTPYNAERRQNGEQINQCHWGERIEKKRSAAPARQFEISSPEAQDIVKDKHDHRCVVDNDGPHGG